MQKTSVALGMFDGVHLGHVRVIESALAQNEFTPMAFTFRGLGKNDENILPYNAKFALLKSRGIKTIYSADFDDDIRNMSPEQFVREILVEKMNAAHVSCGDSFRFSKNAGADARDLQRICAAHGIETHIVESLTMAGGVVSSTRIREAIKLGDIALVNQMLGYDLYYDLEVVVGQKLGRKLGAPTINQSIPAGCVLPKFGVYKSRVLIDVIHYIAVTNIGVKPTVGGNSPVMETHIPGFNTEMYGQNVKVSLLGFIRGEQKFASLEELKEQIQADIRVACSL